MSLLFKAIDFAARAHSGQFRKGSRVPYIVHPLRVAEILIQHGLPEHVVISGILHDTVEDTTVTLGEIRAEFGPGVARIVEAVSEEKSEPWEFRKEHTVEFMKTAPPEALAISLADKIDNILSVCEDYRRKGEAVWDQFNRPRDKQEWYYRS
ncbi:MAG: HD domain-containing protein, partial [Candidatus Latescibacterota bacterium]